MSEAIDVGSTDDIGFEEAIVVPAATTGSVDIAIFHAEDGFFALDDRCTHGAAKLSEGWIEEDTVECPQHASAFCLRNGKVLGLPATQDAPTHKVAVVDGRVLLYPGVPNA